MTYASDPGFLVLHGLRLRGVSSAEAIADRSGLDAAVVHQHLESAEGPGHVRLRAGLLPGWTLTPAGRAHHGDAVAVEMSRAGSQLAVSAAYKHFLGCNNDMLRLCSEWQSRDLSGGSDQPFVLRLAALDSVIQPVCLDLAGAMDRFHSYGARFTNARSKLEAGEVDWLTAPMIDSYHTVWFELHEDLLVTLGIERGKE